MKSLEAPHNLNRRDAISISAAGVGMLLLPNWIWAANDAPTNDPTAHLNLL